MMGLFSAPAVMRAPVLASAAVRATVAVGHRFDRTSRVTCCDARAVSRATDIWGLFFRASACASFSDNTVGAPALLCEGPPCTSPFGALGTTGVAVCRGMGAGGKLENASVPDVPWANVNAGNDSAKQIDSSLFITAFQLLGSWLLSPRACHRRSHRPRAR